MKFLIIFLIFLIGCAEDSFRPTIPADVLAELQGDKKTMFNMSSEIDWRLSRALDKHTEKTKIGETVLIYINSNGGDVNAAENIINTMSRYRTVCVADTAMSAAFEIYQHCTIRVYMDRTVLMAHYHSIWYNGMLSVNEAFLSGLEAYIQQTALLRKCAARMEMSYLEFTGKIDKEKEWYLFGKDLVKYHAVDYHIKIADLRIAK
jgi:ATP-dependent protease ClpP protease subunit